MKKLILINIAIFASAISLYSQNILSTYPANTANNGNAGITFEIEVIQPITLDELWSQTSGAGTSTVTLWYKPGSYFGQQTVSTANGWIQLQTGVSATGGGSAGAPVLFAGNIGLILQPGKYGFHMTTSNCGYKSWNATSQDVFTDTYLTLRNGTNYGYGGGTANSFHPRQFCGEVRYTPLSSSPNDAGVTSIDSPAAFCPGTETIMATIRNFGVNQINPVTVNWSVNGFLQTPVVYNQVLDTINGLGSPTAQVSLGPWTFTAGVTDTIVVWTSSPNGNLDTNNMNDSAIAWLQPSLSGTYTIDTGSTADYNTFSEALQDLEDFGVCGPITYNVAAGVYNEQIELDNYTGASEVNNITFIGGQDSLGDPNVVVTFTGTSAANYTAKISGDVFMSFESIDFTTTGTTYARVFDVAASSSNVSFIDCHFNGDPTGTTSTFDALFFSSSAAAHSDYSFRGCTFNEGSYGFYFFYGGTAASYTDGLEFIGNTFTNQFYDVLYYVRFHNDFKFVDNTVTTNTNSTGYDFTYYLTVSGNSEITGNFIDGGDDGFYFLEMGGSPTESPLFANNVVIAGKSTTGYVSYMQNTNFARIVNNTFIGAHTSFTNSALRINSGVNNTVLNNIIYMDNSSTSTANAAMYYAANGIASVSDYNNIYLNGSGYIAEVNNTSYLTLADLQNGVGMDTNSLNIDPMYIDLSDPRTCSDTIDGAAMPLAYITDDFEGDGRDPLTPDIGADEYTGSASFSAGDDAFVCSGKGVTIGIPSSNLDSIRWTPGGFGDTAATLRVTDVGTYTITAKSSCSDTVQVDEVIVTDLTAEATFTTTADFFTGKFVENAVNADSLVWTVDNGTTTDTFFTNTVTYIFPDNGPYDITLCVYNDCDTVCSTQQWMGFVGVNETSLASGIKLMPNPATDQVNVQFNNVEGDVTVELNNIQGQVVYTERYVNAANANVSINVSNLNKGMYIMKFITDDEIATKQLIVQ